MQIQKFTALLAQAERHSIGLSDFGTWVLTPTVIAAPEIGVIAPQQSNGYDCGVRSCFFLASYGSMICIWYNTFISFARLSCARSCITWAWKWHYDFAPRISELFEGALPLVFCAVTPIAPIIFCVSCLV